MAKRDGGNMRPARVGERIRAELMELHLRGQIKDPAAKGLVVHEVRVSGDLQHARVYVRLFEDETSVRANRPGLAERRQAALMKALERAKGFLRRQIGERLQLRYTPELVFFWDDTSERATRIEAILEEIALEKSASEESE